MFFFLSLLEHISILCEHTVDKPALRRSALKGD